MMSKFFGRRFFSSQNGQFSRFLVGVVVIVVFGDLRVISSLIPVRGSSFISY